MKKDKGFNLIEMIVAMGIFTMVAVLSASILLLMTDAQRKAVAIQSTQDNLRFALEVMAKDIRTGRLFGCDLNGGVFPPPFPFPSSWSPTDCAGGGKVLTFRDAQGKVITYRHNTVRKAIEKIIDDDTANPLYLTGDDVVIEINFYVFGSGNADNKQTLITITIKGSAGVGRREETNFILQTTVTQRRVEFSS